MVDTRKPGEITFDTTFANNGVPNIPHFSRYVFWGQETPAAVKITIRSFFTDFWPILYPKMAVFLLLVSVRKPKSANNGVPNIPHYSRYVFWGQKTPAAVKIMIRPLFADFQPICTRK